MQRHRDVSGDRGQQALVIGAIKTFDLRALDADHAHTRVAHADWNAQIRECLFANHFGAELEASPVRLAVDDERLARLDDPAGQALAVLERLELVAILVGEVDDAGRLVVQRDVGDIGLEHRADVLAHQLEQLGEVELARELLRNGVDGGELGGALLRLGKEARVFDGNSRLQR